MQIVAKCPKCDAGLPVEAADGTSIIRCGRCTTEIPVSFTEALRTDRAVDRCPVCGGGDFYTRKDFDPKVGVAIVAIGAMASAVFYWLGRDLTAYAILGGAALIDLAVYGWLKDLTVCYRCHSEFRGGYERTAPGFDLHTADVLELEYQRKIGRR